MPTWHGEVDTVTWLTPALVRVTTHMLEPVSARTHAETGAWWRPGGCSTRGGC